MGGGRQESKVWVGAEVGVALSTSTTEVATCPPISTPVAAESYELSAEVLPSERSDAGTATFASGDGSLPADCGEALARSDELYDSLTQWLCGQEAGRLTHAELEERLQADGRELLRQIYQAAGTP